MPKEKILIIEDEKNIIELVTFNLKEEGFLVVSAGDGRKGLESAQKSSPDLIILDLMLPEVDGIDVCKILKQNSKTAAIPILMLTAKSEEIDKIIGLELGADDYMTKPFSPRELVARIRAILRRIKIKPMIHRMSAGHLEMNLDKHQVTIKNKEIELTSKEFDLLRILMESEGRVLSRDFLLENVWGYDQSIQIETRTIDMHVGQLRKKIKSESNRIVTVKNVGYRFDVDD